MVFRKKKKTLLLKGAIHKKCGKTMYKSHAHGLATVECRVCKQSYLYVASDRYEMEPKLVEGFGRELKLQIEEIEE